ncbi:phosphate signaling complex protein PhoU [Alkaliphilus oremlandii]|uniref:Phosphate-specific transport system accessory protein PhoU n=1 Tax=Alkaliphilus oremlandii (strain OhILAs) TaxID=350688 RepID=A8MGX2_ALKOO|nr:phosphate signaling complex protein PhoU [Alkaliphilus oremlandii]ABW18666.1 phosphate uptake regulator, PhoU [Alkaliphilus oremlandii OhILAs]
MRTHFAKDIRLLKEMFIEMGKQSQQVIKLSVESLKEQNIEKANLAIKLDDKVDELDFEIENKCLLLIALQQPIAKDLRSVGTLLKIITDMERIGDYGVNIAKVTLDIQNEKLIKPLIDIPRMTEIIERMLDKSMESFMNEDIELARNVAEMDDEVDMIYTNINDELMDIIAQNPTTLKQATCLLLVARYLERIADHITNICERIIYMVTGERVEIN